jgi:hypothetical protein
VSNATVAKQTMADDKTVAKVRRKLEATSEIPRLEETTGRDGRSRPATTSRAPSQKAGGIAGRTVTAEVDPAASAERRKQEYTADESEREAMTAKDVARVRRPRPATRADNQQGRAGAVRQDERGR